MCVAHLGHLGSTLGTNTRKKQHGHSRIVTSNDELNSFLAFFSTHCSSVIAAVGWVGKLLHVDERGEDGVSLRSRSMSW